MAQALQSVGVAGRNRVQLRLLEDAQMNDVAAALAPFVRRLPQVVEGRA